MKIFFKQSRDEVLPIETELTPVDLKISIEKTRQALENAYSGFDNATENELIDCYIYEINALQKRYQYLTGLLSLSPEPKTKRLNQHSAIRTLVSHVFG